MAEATESSALLNGERSHSGSINHGDEEVPATKLADARENMPHATS